MVVGIHISLSSVEDADVVRWLDGIASTIDRDDLYKRLFIHGCDAARSLHGLIGFSSVPTETTNALQIQIDELRGTLAREREQFDSTLSLNVRLALAEDSASLRAAADTHRKAHAELVDALKALAEGESLRENDALRQRLTSLEVELSTIKRTNHGIGVDGEERVALTLRRLFPHAEIVPKHSDGHSCDLWIEEDDMIIPVEVKNKRDITRADVDRFKKDVAGLVLLNGSRLAGALFLSCRTPNIPGHGAIRLVYDGDLPILFMGMDDNTNMMGSLKSPLELFMSIARRARLLQHKDDPQVELKRILDERLAPMIQRARCVRQSLKEASIASAAALAAAEKELEALCSLADIDLFDSSSNNIMKCAHCGRVCRSQQGLRAHVKACKKNESV
jgi:hypothetical protein